MKDKSKSYRWTPSTLVGLGAALLLLMGSSLSSQAQEPVTNIINAFDTAPSSGNGIGSEWGPGSWAWDSVEGNPAGAAYYTASWDPSSDTPLIGFACEPNGNPWYVNTPINLSSFQTLDFDIKWDNSSDITIDQFNNVGTWPYSLTNSRSGGASVFQSWASTGGAALAADGSINGLEIDLCGGPGGQNAPALTTVQIPSEASNGWVHISVPINQSQAQIDGISGIVFHKWTADTWTLVTNVDAHFWIDNVELRGTTAPAPPPTLSGPTRPVQGLNVFSSTMGNSYYDRQEVMFRTNTALSWIGRASAANPVTYSFSIVGYPKSYNCEAYMFLAPNAVTTGAPDWNNTNCVIIEVQGSTTSAQMTFNYKVKEPNGGSMQGGGSPYTNAPGSWDGIQSDYYESGQLGGVTNNTVMGLWQVRFTSDTNIALIAPNGSTTNLVLPSYNAGYFADSQNFTVYLGMQANQEDGMNQAVVYGSIGISGVPNGYSENFLTDNALDTNVWDNSLSGGPAGVRIITADQASSGYWISHTLPDNGWSLQVGSNLTSMASWESPSMGPTLTMAGITSQLVNGSELPAGGTAFFNMIKRTFTQLQVLLPGQTNAPGTALGYVGSPTPISLSSQGLNPTTITVNACDDSWHIINGISDQIHITTTDSGAYLPSGDLNMVNGTATFSGDNGILFQSQGTWTVSAQDMTSQTVTNTATSAEITVGP